MEQILRQPLAKYLSGLPALTGPIDTWVVLAPSGLGLLERPSLSGIKLKVLLHSLSLIKRLFVVYTELLTLVVSGFRFLGPLSMFSGTCVLAFVFVLFCHKFKLKI